MSLYGVLFFFLAGLGFTEETIHVIQQGETIYSIARMYGVNVQEVLNHNKINDSRTVQAGTRIRIPGTASSGTTAITSVPVQIYDEYRVERSDTLYSLARRFGISLAGLLDMNGFAPDYVIKAGEKIRVPAQGFNPTGATIGRETQAASGTRNAPAVPNSPAVTVNTSAKPDSAVKWPVMAKEIAYITGKLYGVQVTGEQKEGVKSLTGGTVVSAQPYRGFGRVAIVQATGGYLYVYGGCETLSVKEGDKVVSGTELGKLGMDSKSSKSQLFFFVYKGNTPVDPAKAPRA
jgi:LysM repeat protein